MTESTGQTMAADIEAAIWAVPGVATIFRTGGIISNVLDVGTQVLKAPQNEVTLVRWEHHSAEGLRVEAAIGVYAGAGATETSYRVHAAIADLCAGRGYPLVQIYLTVVHIDESFEDHASRKALKPKLIMPTKISL